MELEPEGVEESDADAQPEGDTEAELHWEACAEPDSEPEPEPEGVTLTERVSLLEGEGVGDAEGDLLAVREPELESEPDAEGVVVTVTELLLLAEAEAVGVREPELEGVEDTEGVVVTVAESLKERVPVLVEDRVCDFTAVLLHRWLVEDTVAVARAESEGTATEMEGLVVEEPDLLMVVEGEMEGEPEAVRDCVLEADVEGEAPGEPVPARLVAEGERESSRMVPVMVADSVSVPVVRGVPVPTTTVPEGSAVEVLEGEARLLPEAATEGEGETVSPPPAPATLPLGAAEPEPPGGLRMLGVDTSEWLCDGEPEGAKLPLARVVRVEEAEGAAVGDRPEPLGLADTVLLAERAAEAEPRRVGEGEEECVTAVSSTTAP